MKKTNAEIDIQTITLGQAIDHDTAIDLLNDLITVNRGIVNVYKTAGARLKIPPNVDLLRSNAEQHELFITELNNAVLNHGGDPTTHSTGSSLLKQAWVSIKAAMAHDDGSILAEVVQDAHYILVAYREAMDRQLADNDRDLIRTQMSEARIIYKKLAALSAAYNN